MANDGSELTFVRCPSCRSLVPAVSTKCRMCGAIMDSSQGESDQQKNTSRVRQRTTSIRPSDFIPPAEAAESEDWEPVAAGAEGVSRSSESRFDDPLGEYMDDEEINENGGFAGTNGIENSEEFGGDDGEEDDFSFNDGFSPPSTNNPSSGQSPESSRSFNDPRPSSTNLLRGKDIRMETTIPSSGIAVQPITPSTRIMSTPVGRLVGWFVSYTNPDGKGYEMREGKFFITASGLKANDFVVNEPSISTPHAIVQVSKETGIRVQDLMSDTGVHIKKKGTSEFQREEGAISCSTGDVIRFGDVEFVVTIVGDLIK